MLHFIHKSRNLMADYLSQLQKDSKEVIIFGAGRCGEEYLSILSKYGIHVAYFVDDNTSLQSTGVCGYNVYPVDLLEKYKSREREIIIASYGPDKLLFRLNEVDPILAKRARKVDFYLWEDGLDYYDYFSKFHKEISDARSLLSDKRSQYVFDNLLQYKISRDSSLLYAVRDDEAKQYVDESIIKFNDNEIFVDCGAYTGDTILRFLHSTRGKYGKIYALEPDSANYAQLNMNFEQQENIVTLCCGAADITGNLSFCNDSTWTSRIDEHGTQTIKVITIDDLLKNENCSFLKADIEGYELQMLHGAENCIRRCHPKLAIAAYHRKEDIFKIILTLHEYNPAYRFFLRHYTEMPIDSVLYAV